eukprot:6027953-Amphidinium_carterae.1
MPQTQRLLLLLSPRVGVEQCVHKRKASLPAGQPTEKRAPIDSYRSCGAEELVGTQASLW